MTILAVTQPAQRAEFSNPRFQAFALMRGRLLGPEGVGVMLDADHLCMTLRGVQAAESPTVTSAGRELLRDDPRSRQKSFAPTRVTA